MSELEGPFATRAEALAFARGVEWVNDSAVEVVAVRELPEGYYVEVFDGDRTPEAVS